MHDHGICGCQEHGSELRNNSSTNRRDVLAGLGLAAAGTALGGAGFESVNPAFGAAASNILKTGRIDVHNHMVPPVFVPYIKAGGMYAPTLQVWSPSYSIENSDKRGIATAMVSLTNPKMFPTGAEMIKLARDCNEYAAKLASDYPGRFGSFATLPLPDIDAALKEIEYALGTLKADGVYIWTNYENIWMGDPKWNPIWEELNRRKAIIYTHPRSASCCGNLPIAIDEIPVDWQTDTTRAIANTIFSGTAAKYPDMKIIWSHGGGTMPYLVHRLIGIESDPRYKGRVPGGFLNMARKMYYDTAQQLLPPAEWPLKYVATVPQILFGTDFPYAPENDTGKALQDNGIFTPAELRMIDRTNAERLFPRLKA